MTTTHITRRAQLGELNTLYGVHNILIFNALLGLSVVDLAVAVAEAAVLDKALTAHWKTFSTMFYDGNSDTNWLTKQADI